MASSPNMMNTGMKKSDDDSVIGLAYGYVTASGKGRKNDLSVKTVLLQAISIFCQSVD